MIEDPHGVYPACSAVPRVVKTLGLRAPELVERLERCAIAMNDLARQLLASERFAASREPRTIRTVELAVRNLGLPAGGTLPEITDAARVLGLEPCPLELAPYLRLELLEQDEGSCGEPSPGGQAPPGAITIASDLVPEDHAAPRGFYLRCMDGVLWLRGYRASDDHLWRPGDRFVFQEG